MSLILTALWGVAGLLFGILLFFVLPLLAAARFDYDARAKVADWYLEMAMLVIGRAQILDRKNSGFDLVQSEFDPEMEGELIEIGGKTGHAMDVADLMDRLHGKPLGLIKEPRNVITAPHMAGLGSCYGEVVEDGRDKVTVRTPTGDGDATTTSAYRAAVTLPDTSGLVDLSESLRVIPGSADLWLGELSKDFVKKSQMGFRSSFSAEHMLIIMAFAAGFALPVLAIWQFGGATGGGFGGIADSFAMSLGVPR
jgi:hypothetical protein